MKRICIPEAGNVPYVMHEDGVWYFVTHYNIYVCKDSAPLGEVAPGMDIFIGDEQYTVLGHGQDTTALLYSGRYTVFCTPHIRRNDVVLDALAEAENCHIFIPKDMLVPHTVKLMAANGDRPKENVKCNISLLTMDLYRRYRPYLADKELDEFWLATPTSYAHENNELCFVREDGRVGWCPYPHGYFIRPFVIVDSAYTGYSLPELAE